MLIKKPVKQIKHQFVFRIYCIISALIIGLILYTDILPKGFTEGPTSFKVISELIISFIYTGVAVFLFKIRKTIDRQLFLYIQSSIILTIFFEVLFAQFLGVYDYTVIVGHALKVIAFYLMYKGIIEIGLQKPYEVLFNKLHETNNNLKSKTKQLEFTSRMLKKESTERKNMEEILLNNEKSYEIFIQNSRDAVYVHSGGKFAFANHAAVKLLGFEKTNELIGRPLFDFIHPDYTANTKECINNVYKTKGAMPFTESKMINVHGDALEIETAAYYFIHRGEPAILTVLRDISSHKKIEALQHDIKQTREFNKMMTEFFTNISHELKTPLNVILSAIQILGMKNSQDKIDKYIKMMKQNSYRLVRLVNNLIDISKLESGYIKPKLSNHNIVAIVENITLSVVDYIENKGVELIFDTDVEDKIIAIDADKIERIILNLLSNALKFTKPGDNIMVNVSDMEESVLISVKDTGIGIPEDKQELIFERFGQVDKTLSRNHEGSGIGLSLVKSLVHMHEGTIRVNSKSGEGSEFIIEIPARIVNESESLENAQYQTNVEKISIEFSDIYAY